MCHGLDGHATGVRSLAGAVQRAGLQEQLDPVGLGGHVGAFGHDLAAVLDQHLRVVADPALLQVLQGLFHLFFTVEQDVVERHEFLDFGFWIADLRFHI